MKILSVLFVHLLLAALAAHATPLPLQDGESFTYRVSWAVLPGAGEIKVSAAHDTSGVPHRLRVTTTTQTRGLARALMSFEAQGESLFDTRNGRLISLHEKNRLRGKSGAHVVWFDYEHERALYTDDASPANPRTLEMPAGEPRDLITALIETRHWDLKPGEKRDALVLFDDDFYELTIYAERYEDVKTPLGVFKTLLLVPRMEKTEPKGMFRRGSTARVWISQDGQRLPVRFEVEFKVGTGVANLAQFRLAPPPEPAVAP